MPPKVGINELLEEGEGMMSKFNKWFTGLPEEEQEVLREDKWVLAERAFNEACNGLDGIEVVCMDKCSQKTSTAYTEVIAVIKMKLPYNLKLYQELKGKITHETRTK